MQTKEYRNIIDRTDWPSGPWDGEPDKRYCLSLIERIEATGV